MNRFEWERAVLASDLTANARLVALVLATRADPDLTIPRQYSPSLQRLARDCGLSRSTVQLRIEELAAAGWIQRDQPSVAAARTQHLTVGYTLVVPAGAIPTTGTALYRPPVQPVPTVGTDAQGLGRPSVEPVPTTGTGLGRQSVPASSSSRSSRTTAAASDDPLAEYGLTDEQRADFMAHIGAKGNGLLVHLARSGDLPVRVAEWQLAHDAHPVAERSEWDRLPNITEMRLQGRLPTGEAPISPERMAEIRAEMRQQARQRRRPDAELLQPPNGPPYCPYCGHPDRLDHRPFNCVPHGAALYEQREPVAQFCTTCARPLPCAEHQLEGEEP